MGKFRKTGLIFLLIWAMILSACGCTRFVSISSADENNQIEQSEDEASAGDTDDASEDEEETTEKTTTESDDKNADTTEQSGELSEESSETEESTQKTTQQDNTEDESLTQSAQEGTTTSGKKPDAEPVTKPGTAEPVTKPTQPVTKPTETPTTQPATVKPTEPATAKPVVTEPATTKPVVTKPATTKPVVSTTAATTASPTTTADPTTQAASTEVTNLYTELASYSNITKEEIIEVRGIINSIITADMSEPQKIKAVHDWLVKNTTYEAAYYSRSDSHNHLYNILYNKIGVCQSYSVAFYVFMGEMGIPCTFIVGSADNGTGAISHAWNAVQLNNEWYLVDATWDDPIVNGTSNYSDGYNMAYTYLLCPNNVMSNTHTAEKYVKTQPDAFGTSTEYNELMYKLSGYKDVYRITTYEDLNTELVTATESGTYVIMLDGEGLDGKTTFDKVVEYLRTTGRGFSINGMYSTTSVSVTITYTT